ncbi:GNAT family N-acetyltransferase [Streptomyces sp. NPDC004111]|uniref:GNAT family N-acetyltransferase n=1 Tax=Streptomyces sp. NPDC004111 TaxID=3364690 RepID=UPI0036C9C745
MSSRTTSRTSSSRTSFRPAVESDLERFLPLLVADPASTLTADLYRTKLADGQYRSEWTWIAEGPADASGRPVLAVAVWWGLPTQATPGALDAVYVADVLVPQDQRVSLAAELLTAAHEVYTAAGAAERPAFHIFLPGDFHDRPEVTEALSWRREVAEAAGLAGSVERLRYEWKPQDGLPEPASSRLTFTPEPDDEVFVDLFRRVLEGTLDAGSRKEAERIGAEAQARGEVALYQEQLIGERSWWRVARDGSGEPVGFGIPSLNPAGPVVGYLGVLPEHRGQGYVDEILVWITRFLATEAEPEAPQIRADTDVTNRPTAAAFERAGYRNETRRLVLCEHS